MHDSLTLRETKNLRPLNKHAVLRKAKEILTQRCNDAT